MYVSPFQRYVEESEKAPLQKLGLAGNPSFITDFNSLNMLDSHTCKTTQFLIDVNLLKINSFRVFIFQHYCYVLELGPQSLCTTRFCL